MYQNSLNNLLKLHLYKVKRLDPKKNVKEKQNLVKKETMIHKLKLQGQIKQIQGEPLKMAVKQAVNKIKSLNKPSRQRNNLLKYKETSQEKKSKRMRIKVMIIQLMTMKVIELNIYTLQLISTVK